MVEPASPTADAAPAPPRPERTPLPTVLTWGAPIVGASAGLFFVQFFFLNFATDVLLIAPGTLGILIGVSRLWDAVSDPIAGYYSDRTQLRMGRRRPWIAGGGAALAISLVLMWAPPVGLEQPWLTVWVGVGLLLFTTASTALRGP